MQIITLEDQDFPDLLAALQDAKLMGRYWKNGKLQIVRANRRFMMVSRGENPKKIAIKPARSISEAEDLARQFLAREEQRGSDVEVDEQAL